MQSGPSAACMCILDACSAFIRLEMSSFMNRILIIMYLISNIIAFSEWHGIDAVSINVCALTVEERLSGFMIFDLFHGKSP